MNPTDLTLLELFARERNEAAFAELAERHGSLIFHTALRSTGNRAMAEEVSQRVFCALASKSCQLTHSLKADGLAPWLHRATMFEASKALRAESSQQRRKQLIHPDTMPSTGPETSPWEEALPHLDLVLDKLGESDRRVLILHFFRRLSFREIAASTGKSSEAVQKQSSRALEKLSRLLRSRGVVVPVAVLAVGLSAESAKAAPVALLSTLAARACSTTISLPLNPILAMFTTQTKIIVPLTVIICAIPLAMQQAAISSSERQLTSLRQDPDSVEETTATTTNRKRSDRPDPKSSGLVSASCDWQTLFNESNKIRNSADRAAYIKKLESMSPEQRASVIKEVAAQDDIPPIVKAIFFQSIVSTLIETDPELACTTVMDAFKGNPLFDHLFNNSLGFVTYERWVEKDPASAQAWFETLRQEKESGTWAPDKLFKNFQLPLFRSLVRNSPDAAREMLDEGSPEARENLMRSAVSSFLDHRRAKFYGNDSKTEQDPAQVLAYLQYARELPAKAGGPPLLQEMASRLAKGNRIEELQTLFDSGNLSVAEKQIIGSQLAADSLLHNEQSAATQALLKKAMPGDADRLMKEANSNQSK